MRVMATHYICIKDKEGKDLLIIRRSEERVLNKKEFELLQKEAPARFKIIEESTNGKD